MRRLGRYRITRTPFVPSAESFVFLESQVESLVNRRDVQLRRYGHWSTEIYGMGILYRSLLRWPMWRKLPFTSEHGIPFGTSSVKYALEGWSRNSARRLHVTWSGDVAAACRNAGLDVVQIPHPWSVSWRAAGWKPEAKWSGPLLVVPHSLPSVHFPGGSTYWEDFLSAIPSDLFPTAALISSHDVGSQAEMTFRRWRIPMYCVGRPTGDLFFHRFYNAIGQFPLLIGPNVSSASFYAEDFGIPFLLVGQEVKFDYESYRDTLGDWSQALHSRMEFRSRAQEYFSVELSRRSSQGAESRSFVSSELGLSRLDFDFRNFGAQLQDSLRS